MNFVNRFINNTKNEKNNNEDVKLKSTNNDNISDIASRCDDDNDDNDSIIESTGSTISFKLATDGASKTVQIIQNDNLIRIGKQLKLIETQCIKDDEKDFKQWSDNIKPGLKATIKSIEAQIIELKKKLTLSLSSEQIDALEKCIDDLNMKLDGIKKTRYFPYNKVAYGTGGVYVTWDNMFLEEASGKFHFEMFPGCTNNYQVPTIVFTLSGTSVARESGMSMALLLH
jgi:hypothetical protein